MRWEAEGEGGEREGQKDGLTTDGATEGGEQASPRRWQLKCHLQRPCPILFLWG